MQHMKEHYVSQHISQPLVPASSQLQTQSALNSSLLMLASLTTLQFTSRSQSLCLSLFVCL
ncbi:hypothetical protein E2C01_074657 [Portunus trituberculatus]|uniref:Uncharacterized protein n=1 Tax=Portunus trituberculatus TaxID=210409 RepID=A0A5B7I676_PORTR|nr:hypothetical protein [Portunus trituberculatus]